MGGARLVSELGPNAYGELPDPGRVADCYLALPLPAHNGAGAGRVLVIAPRALLHPRVPQPAGSLLYELATGHPDRGPRELVFPADLAGELRAWPPDTSAPLTAELAAVAAAVVGCWQRGDLLGLELALEPGEDARAHPPGDDAGPRGVAGPAGRPGRPRPLPLAAPKQRPARGRVLPVARGHGGAPHTAVFLRRAGGALPARQATGPAADGGRQQTSDLSEQTPHTCPSGHCGRRVDTRSDAAARAPAKPGGQRDSAGGWWLSEQWSAPSAVGPASVPGCDDARVQAVYDQTVRDGAVSTADTGLSARTLRTKTAGRCSGRWSRSWPMS
jgi:hypothetical protein